MPLQPGDKIGPFTIVEQIGAGGAAIVYKAHDPLLDRFVAVKLIADPTADRAALRREAATHKSLTADKPDLLVQLIDATEDDRGLMLISEFVPGESLEQRLARKLGPMTESRAARIIAQTAGALFFIHKRGMIHRDVKPANVLLTENDRVKLADFGLTVALADQRAMDSGTVRYMAPELLRGEPADQRADLYALGMMAYEMLAGRQKFDEAFAPVLRDRRNAAMRWVKWHTNPRTTAPPLTDLNPQINPRLAELVARLMDKDPQRRVADANELILALQRIHTQTGRAPSEPDAANQTAAPAGDTAPIPHAGNTRTVLALVFTILAVAILGVVGYGWQQQRAAQQRELAAYQQSLADARRAYDDGRYDDAAARYQDIIDVHPDNAVARAMQLAARGRVALAESRYDDAVRSFEQAADADPPQRAAMTHLISLTQQRQAFAAALAQIQSHLDANRFDAAHQLIRQWQPLAAAGSETEQLDALARTIADRRVRAAAAAVMARARDLAAQDRLDDAIDLLAPAVPQFSTDRALSDYYDQLVEQRDYQIALTEARAAEAGGDVAAALRAYRQAAALKPSPQLQSSIDKLESADLLAQGMEKLEAGDLAEAERLLILALGKDADNQRARAALDRMETVNQAQGFLAAGDAALQAGDFDAAVRQYENAARIGADPIITDRLKEARVRKLLHDADVALTAGDVDRAAALVTEARNLAPGHELIAPAEQDLQTRGEYLRQLTRADAARDRSDFAAAESAYRKAQQVLDTPEVKQRLDDLEFASSIAQAQAYIDREQYTAALAMLRIALQIRDTEQVRNLITEVEQKSGG